MAGERGFLALGGEAVERFLGVGAAVDEAVLFGFGGGGGFGAAFLFASEVDDLGHMAILCRSSATS